MNLQISGRHLEVTSAIHAYVTEKIERTLRHSDNVIDVNVVLSVDKIMQKAEVTVLLPGKDIHIESIEEDLYAAIDALVDKLSRKLRKHKEKLQDQHHDQKVVGA